MIALCLLALLSDPTPLDSKIQDVTLYASSAIVHRTAQIPGPGQYAVRGLPRTLDKSNVRVRCAGGDVVSVEVRERLQESVPSERLQALRDRLEVLGREMQASQDELDVQRALGEHLVALLRGEPRPRAGGGATGVPESTNWAVDYDFLSRKLTENKAALREARWKHEQRTQAYKVVEGELGRASGPGGVLVHDVIVDVSTERAATLDVEYLVTNTGWQPHYDLRASMDLAQVELGYRARVWQRTGEDWTDVALALSTAQPQRGARGPEPEPIWLSIFEPRLRAGLVQAEAPAAAAEYRKRDGASDDRYKSKDADAESEQANKAPPFASVANQGLSVRFVLARRETVESREQPTTVLVGRATLAVEAERFCTPALDPTVWLRGKARNTSAWTILPGPAAVFLGADYLGLADLDAVQPGAEFTLHLGADPGVTVKRTQTEDQAKGPGFLSSRASKVESWRIHIENHGTLTAAKDGSVHVFVREALPRARDERVEIELSKSEPKPASEARWKGDREDKGIETWVLLVPKGGSTDLVFQTTVTYPKGAEVTRD